ncbi:MAG: alanine racemase, partial [Eudoraea sp.]|nr:alanine racemase [Eudoraea sp.]
DIDFIENELSNTSCIEIRSVFSHLAASDDLNEQDFTNTQIATFNKIYANINDRLGVQPIKHILNTSGILNYANAQFDMVRCGIGLHGYANDPEIDNQLKPTATLKTIISQIHKIEPNETVGYNRGYTSEGYQTTATLPIGHADGIGRHFGNSVGEVHVNGSSAPIIGNVCMDMLMIDITGIECKEGDEVVIFGGAYSAESLAGKARTISYELITGISQRIPRLITGSL